MNKMNKKGFTLIEMLVVIAIIAVLVSIIIPTVTSATDKAGAATNAANLRSVIAEATTKYLTNDPSDKGYVTVTIPTDGSAPTVSVNESAPAAAKVGTEVTKESVLTVTWDATINGFVGKYGDYRLEDFQKVASGECQNLTDAVAATKPAG